LKSVSVVIPTLGDRPSLRLVLDALAAQTRPPDDVIVVVSNLATATASIPLPEGIKVVRRDERLWPGAARNAGACLATTELLAFLDDDVIPRSDWLETMLAAQAWTGGAVIGSVGIARTGGFWGMATWFAEFASIHPYLPSRVVAAGGGSGNLLLPRAAFMALGGFAGVYRMAEDTQFLARLRESGTETYFEAKGLVGHCNRSSARAALRHQFRLGYWSGRCRREWYGPSSRILGWTPFGPTLWLYRALRLYGRLLRYGRGYRGAGVRYAFGVVVVLLAWNAGFLSGLQAVRQRAKAPSAAARFC
jgi:GT2 family glycosyltransferase